jgi:hypothetical protein
MTNSTMSGGWPSISNQLRKQKNGTKRGALIMMRKRPLGSNLLDAVRRPPPPGKLKTKKPHPPAPQTLE